MFNFWSSEIYILITAIASSGNCAQKKSRKKQNNAEGYSNISQIPALEEWVVMRYRKHDN
uniref:Uncharacterized protein n=1 Tax=Arundo donax TaxID=35708 RepID=A0A0A8YMG9_ARUDO